MSGTEKNRYPSITRKKLGILEFEMFDLQNIKIQSKLLISILKLIILPFGNILARKSLWHYSRHILIYCNCHIYRIEHARYKMERSNPNVIVEIICSDDLISI